MSPIRLHDVELDSEETLLSEHLIRWCIAVDSLFLCYITYFVLRNVIFLNYWYRKW
jgi:hypothetical protein